MFEHMKQINILVNKRITEIEEKVTFFEGAVCKEINTLINLKNDSQRK
jgi:hypothetical protein